MKISDKYKQIKDLLVPGRNVVILTHANPDGDAIGSSIALALFLQKLEYPVNIIIPDKVPDFLSWLPGMQLISVYKDDKEKASGLIQDAGIIFCLDFNDPDRINSISENVRSSPAHKILIDHHSDPVAFADITISEPWRASVGEMIYELLIEIYDPRLIDRDIATAIYVAIMTDTGGFSYGNVYPDLFRIAGELLEYGIDRDSIHTRVYDSFSEDRMRLMGYCMMQKMVVLHEFNTAYITVSSAELRRFNYVKGDTEGFVNIPFSIKGIKFTALFIEKKDHIKASFRSRGTFEVNKFAEKHFNGGGHRNAAGGERKGTMEETIKEFEKLLVQYKSRLSEV